MPVRVPFHTVVVTRNGKHVRPKIGEPFEFTAEEIAHFHKNDSRSLRMPRMERLPVPVADLDEGEDEASTGAASEVTSDKTLPTAPRKAPAKRPAAVVDDTDEL